MPLVLPPDEPCSFCRYLAGERRYTILEHGPVVSMLVTFEQRGLGHVLVVPTAHRRTVLELAPAEHGPLLEAVARAAAAIAGAYDPEGIAVWQNNGVPAHQSVPHLHVHVAGAPTERDDVPRLSFDETDAIADRLRPHLAPPP